MKRQDNYWVWILVGAVGPMVLGIVLLPLRTHALVSNLAFVFLAFTIIVAELGGRFAALVTALMSAITLNFGLTRPYQHLAMGKREDIIAFFALAACGLIAAAFGKQRRSLSEAASRESDELDILKKLTEQLRDRIPLEEILYELKNSFRLSAIALRDSEGRILAAVPTGSEPVIPKTQLNPDSLLPSDETTYRYGVLGFRLPEEGGRLSLQTDRGVYSLDLWEGDPQGFTVDESRTLAAAALILGFELSHHQEENKRA